MVYEDAPDTTQTWDFNAGLDQARRMAASGDYMRVLLLDETDTIVFDSNKPRPQSKVKNGVLTMTANQAGEKLCAVALPVGYWETRDRGMRRFYVGDSYIQHTVQTCSRGRSSYYDRHRSAKGDDFEWWDIFSFEGDEDALKDALVAATGADDVAAAMHGVFVNQAMNPAFARVWNRIWE